MDNDVTRKRSSKNSENIGVKMNGSDDADQERRIMKRDTKEVIQLQRCLLKASRIQINSLWYST